MLERIKNYWIANREDLSRGGLAIGISLFVMFMVGFIRMAA